MRLLFEKGLLKEILKKEKIVRNLTWNELSKALGIKPAKLKSFYYEENLIDDSTFNKLKVSRDYQDRIKTKLSENWGRSKGGLNSKGNTKTIIIPERSEDLAEFLGIVLGDGHVHKVKGHKIGVYSINITGHSILDKNYLIKFVKPLGEKMFNVEGKLFYSKRSKALHIIFYSRDLVDFFIENEFKSGDKIKNQVKIPDWIKSNPKYLSGCLRGLFDTDGCFYRLTNQNSCQIGFTNHNLVLLRDVRDGLLSLGISVSNIMDNRKIVITKKSEIAKFYKSVGFHNSKHLSKINRYLAP